MSTYKKRKGKNKNNKVTLKKGESKKKQGESEKKLSLKQGKRFTRKGGANSEGSISYGDAYKQNPNFTTTFNRENQGEPKQERNETSEEWLRRKKEKREKERIERFEQQQQNRENRERELKKYFNEKEEEKRNRQKQGNQIEKIQSLERLKKKRQTELEEIKQLKDPVEYDRRMAALRKEDRQTSDFVKDKYNLTEGEYKKSKENLIRGQEYISEGFRNNFANPAVDRLKYVGKKGKVAAKTAAKTTYDYTAKPGYKYIAKPGYEKIVKPGYENIVYARDKLNEQYENTKEDIRQGNEYVKEKYNAAKEGIREAKDSAKEFANQNIVQPVENLVNQPIVQRNVQRVKNTGKNIAATASTAANVAYKTGELGYNTGKYVANKTYKNVLTPINDKLENYRPYKGLKRTTAKVFNKTANLSNEIFWDSFKSLPDKLQEPELTKEVNRMMTEKNKWDEYYYKNFNPDRPFTQLLSSAAKVASNRGLKKSFDKVVKDTQFQIKKQILLMLIYGKAEIVADPPMEKIKIGNKEIDNEINPSLLQVPGWNTRLIKQEIDKDEDGFFTEEAMEYELRMSNRAVEKIGDMIQVENVVKDLLRKRDVPEHKFMNDINNAGKLFTIKGALMPVVGNWDPSKKNDENYNKEYEYGKEVQNISTEEFNKRNTEGKLPVLILSSNKLDLPAEVKIIRKDCPREDQDPNDPNTIYVNDATRCHFFSTWE